MRIIRRLLMQLMNEASVAWQAEDMPARLRALLLHEGMAALPLPHADDANKPFTLRWRTLTRGSLHRHVLIIRCPDQAFYLGAIKSYLSRHNIEPIRLQALVASLQCNEHQYRLEPEHPSEIADDNFMLIAIHLSATVVTDIESLQRDICALLEAVDISVEDFPLMLQRMANLASALQSYSHIESELLQWMHDDRYIIYGMQQGGWRKGLMRRQRLLDRIIPGLRQQLADLPAAKDVGLTWLALSSALNHIYSPARIEVVRICWLEANDTLGECLLIGHFSRSGRYTNASEVPRLRESWQTLRYSHMLRYSSFYRRELRSIYDRMPKPVLFAVPGIDWVKPLREISDLGSPVHMHVTHLIPEYGDIEYLLMVMMNDRFDSNIMTQIRQTLATFQLLYHDHVAITMGEKRILVAAISAPEGWPDTATLHIALQSCIVCWKDRAKRHVLRHAKGIDIPAALKKVEQLPRLYQELYPPEQFLEDLRVMRMINESPRHLVRVHYQQDRINLHVYAHQRIALGELIRKIQAFGLLAEQESLVNFGTNGHKICLINLHCAMSESMRMEAVNRLQQALECVLNVEADDDILNTLVITAGLDIRQIAVLITLRNHLIQLMTDAAPGALSNMMTHYPSVTAALYRIFEALHRPAMPATARAQRTLEFSEAMRTVSSLTHDRWFRALQSLVQASLRTNAYQRDMAFPLAIKVDSSAIDFVPRPRPFREIFVHGIGVEGVHLRAGAVARGGIRYSDRKDDYRTEILELMATQTVKNGQILPTGAKGGFIVRQAQPTPQQVLQQYRLFIRALLELTDNLVNQQVVNPAGIRITAKDQQDPYLVVAADKGTARFSDDANAEAREANFWLDDAFASGGSCGYDHKAFGITARGAWVCTCTHFHQLDRNANQDAISVVGIGDMGGDVFGNGMLINPHIRLLAAFNHRHIFLDPNPNTDTAFAERQRLFQAVQGWDAYNPTLISLGGGVFERDSKHIPLSQEVRATLGVQEEALSGEALIRAVLKAPVDLLYNGGIGTYVKSTEESHQQVRDPSNNAVRVNAADLRCSVVCEGGNLGFSQKARLEYAEQGGLIYTDAIDNAAGVNMSDHEVNLKILLSATDTADIGRQKRDRLLARVANEVAEQCLQANARQAMALELAQLDCQQHLPRYIRLRESLLHDKRLDLRVDPRMHDDQTLKLAPQLAVLLGHEKNRLHDAFNEACYADWSLFASKQLHAYCPRRIARRYTSAIDAHPLHNSLAHTCIANHIVDFYGVASVHHLQSMLGCRAAEACESLLISEHLLRSEPILHAITQQLATSARLVLQIRHAMQEYHLCFAEELLRLMNICTLGNNWLQRQQRGLRQFCRSKAALGVGDHESSRFLTLLREASRAGLDPIISAELAVLPETAQMAPAIYLSRHLQKPLKQCLHAMQALLHLLPFSAIEQPMRSAEWGSGDAHLLRREWFHRLSQLKARAGECLLRQGNTDFLTHGEQCWSAHPHWSGLQSFANDIASQTDHTNIASESERTRLMLMMARLETLIEEQNI